jgi:hypothetical protein
VAELRRGLELDPVAHAFDLVDPLGEATEERLGRQLVERRLRTLQEELGERRPWAPTVRIVRPFGSSTVSLV